MGGPIVRTGTTPKFWENYDRIFSGTKKAAKKDVAKVEAKPVKKSAKKAAAKKKK
jgi:hypothetical protein